MPGDSMTSDRRPILEVCNLRKYFPIRKGVLRRVVGQVRAVDDVSFAIGEGETLGLVGESGCGKTTTARCILRALDPSDGQILFRTAAGETVDVAGVPERDIIDSTDHADSSMIRYYDRNRGGIERNATHAVAAFVGAAS